MSQYPTYYPQQMYTGYNPQMQMQQNPTMYMDRLSQLHAQQMQQSQMPVSNQFAPLGKMVDSVEVVKATDIPMDGNMYYFPKADGTEIYAKKWLANGTTEVLTYKPHIEPMQDVNSVAVVPNNEVYDIIVEKLDSINERIEKIEKLDIPKNNNNARGTSKKEVGES